MDGTLDKLQARYFAPYAPSDAPPDPMTLEIWPGNGDFVGVGR